MSRQYDLVVFIGRFQPVHNGHVEVMKKASLISKEVLVIIGSAYRPITYKNPFSGEARKSMVKNAFNKHASNLTTLHIELNIDTIYDDSAWISRVQSFVSKYANSEKKIAIIGHSKDLSSEYLKWFPDWDLIEVDMVEPLDATSVRNLYFQENANLGFIKAVVPPSTFEYLSIYKESEEYKNVLREKKFLEKHNEIYRHLPYPPVFQTADAVVTQSGHVLVIRRRMEPGRGLLALPGGYLNAKTDHSILDCAIRELLEETKIKVPEKVLRGSVVDSHVFDAIGRSERGRIITQAFYIKLKDGNELPKVRGSDDAEKAFWLPFSEVRSEDFFEDHYDIIKFFLSI